MGNFSAEISLLLAFGAGLLSFASPCVLPLIPGYISFVTGRTYEGLVEDENQGKGRWNAAVHAGLFVAGFSVVFVLFGLSVTALGRLAADYQDVIRKVGGVVVVLLGVHLTGLLPSRVLYRERRVHLNRKPAGLAGSFLVGVAFGAGWTPCVGPILASILIFAGTKTHMAQGVFLLLAYTLGLGLPFLVSALILNRFLGLFQGVSWWMRLAGPVSGLFLVGMGILLYFNLLGRLMPQISGY